jgi:hypothetical protein
LWQRGKNKVGDLFERLSPPQQVIGPMWIQDVAALVVARRRARKDVDAIDRHDHEHATIGVICNAQAIAISWRPGHEHSAVVQPDLEGLAGFAVHYD